MQQHHAIVVEQFGTFAEKRVVVADAHVLEHADRDDAVEPAGQVAIILEVDFDRLRHALFSRAHAGNRVLLARERDAGYARAGELGEIESEATPTAADVEDALILRQQQLGCEMAPLGELRIVERLVGGLEIGATVLSVGIQEQGIELAVQIIVVRDIAPRARPRIELQHPAQEIADEPLRRRPVRWPTVASLTQRHREDVGDRAAFDHEAAVHIGFAELEFGVDNNAPFRGMRSETDRDRRSRAVSDDKGRTVRGCDLQSSRGYYPLQYRL